MRCGIFWIRSCVEDEKNTRSYTEKGNQDGCAEIQVNFLEIHREEDEMKERRAALDGGSPFVSGLGDLCVSCVG